MSGSSSVGHSNKTEHVQRQWAPFCGDRLAELLFTYETGSTVLPSGRTGLQSRRHHQGCMHPSGRRQTGGQMHHAAYACHGMRSRRHRWDRSAPVLPPPPPLRPYDDCGFVNSTSSSRHTTYRSAPSLVPHTHTHIYRHTPARAYVPGEGEMRKRRKFGMAKFGTTKVCQIMPRYLKVRGHSPRRRF